MELEELSQALKQTDAKLDDFAKKTEIQSGLESAKQYVKENQLEYIEKEILAAFRQGFHIGVRQERSGKFKEME